MSRCITWGGCLNVIPPDIGDTDELTGTIWTGYRFLSVQRYHQKLLYEGADKIYLFEFFEGLFNKDNPTAPFRVELWE